MAEPAPAVTQTPTFRYRHDAAIDDPGRWFDRRRFCRELKNLRRLSIKQAIGYEMTARKEKI